VLAETAVLFILELLADLPVCRPELRQPETRVSCQLANSDPVGNPPDLFQESSPATVDHRSSRRIVQMMKPMYSAAVCSECQRASLVPDDDTDANFCARCGASNLSIPGAQFMQADVPVFEQLERIVHDAQLSPSEAALIAAELEGVSLRWERPELVLEHLGARLVGLQALCDPKQEYSRLLLLAGMLLTIVCTAMIDRTTMPAPSRRSSGIRSLAFDGEPAEHAVAGRSKRTADS
jgi:hypothetical protein